MKLAHELFVALMAGAGGFIVLSFPNTLAEERVDLDDLPADVRSAIEKQAAGGQIVEVEKETRGGEVFYEAEFILEGKEADILVSADGEFLGKETEDDDDEGDEDGDDDARLEFSDLPEAVRDRLNSAYKGIHFSGFSRESEGGEAAYEASYKDGEIEHELTLTADGDVLASEQEMGYEMLPPAVQQAIDSHFAGATVEESERVELTFYEIELETSDGKEIEVKVLANGQMLEDDDED